jgi:copper(I)-binding protein
MARLAALLVILFAANALAHEYRIGPIGIIHPWARATSASAANGVVYMAISNEGDTVDRLIGVASPVAGMSHLHSNEEVDGVMQMRPVDAIEIAPGDTVLIEPGGLHIMLMGLGAPLVQGTNFPMTLVFETAGSIDIEVHVEAPGAAAPADGMDHGEHDDGATQ